MGTEYDFIKLETNGVDEYGPIYIYVDFKAIIAMSRFRSTTTIILSSGNKYVVKESPSEIFEKIEELKNEQISNVFSALTEAF